MSTAVQNRSVLPSYLEDSRQAAIATIRTFLPQDPEQGRILYDLVLDYPLRDAKGLRPALCIATCRAFGGLLEHALPTAAVLELFHNAFLVHDDIEDGSELRRGTPTLHRAHGVPVAINVGDAMLCLALEPLLDNVGVIGLGPALRVLRLVARMTRETVEGQALELDWIARDRWDVSDADYVRMVEKKTGWYSFYAPVVAGALAARVNEATVDRLGALALDLGTAFQIQDDLLNLQGEVARIGKEASGDLWEGKRTLILLHALRVASPADQARARALLSLPRPGLEVPGQATKSATEVAWLRGLLDRTGSIAHARAVAHAHARRAHDALGAVCRGLPASVHRDCLDELTTFVLTRDC